MKKPYTTQGREARRELEKTRRDEVAQRSLRGESQAEIAAVLDISQPSVHRIIKRAREEAEAAIQNGDDNEALLELARRPEAHRTARYGWIVFIQAEKGGLVWIGFADDVWRKLSFLQQYSPVKLRIRAVGPATSSIARNYIPKFAKFKEYGEWHQPSKSILHVMNELTPQDYPR